VAGGSAVFSRWKIGSCISIRKMSSTSKKAVTAHKNQHKEQQGLGFI
jgi:hypothetical protein